MNNKLYSYFLYILGLVIIEFIITTICVYFVLDISLKGRVLRLDFLAMNGLDDKPAYEFDTSVHIIGIELHYYNYSILIDYLIFIIVIFLILFVVVYSIKKIKKINIGRFRKKSFILFSILISLMLFLHFIPSIIVNMAYYDAYASLYNELLINNGIIFEEKYRYFFSGFIDFDDLIVIGNFVGDLILWFVIGYIFFLFMMYIKNDNKNVGF